MFSIRKKLVLCLMGLLVLKPGGLSAQCNLLCNIDFENIQAPFSGVQYFDPSQISCWKTTATDSLIEVWRGNSNLNSTPAYSGNYFVELNANMASTLYQDFVVAPSSAISISFAHRGRSGTDVMSVSIGPVGGPYTTLGTYSDNNMAWGYYTVNYTIPVGSGTNYSLRFNSVSTADSDNSVGNFLDAITVTVASATTLNFNTNHASCFGSLTGAAEVVVTNGLGPYTYTWSPAASQTNSIVGVSAGTYTVNVMESNGCRTTGTVQITQNTAMTTTISSQNASCVGTNNGSAMINASGDLAPYTYVWAHSGATTPVVTGLQRGIYSVMVTGSSGCTKTATVAVSADDSLAISVLSNPASCAGMKDGSAQVTVSGGDSPYTYTWSSSAVTTASLSSLQAGTYQVNVSSSNGCAATATYTINNLAQAVTASFSPSVTNGLAPLTINFSNQSSNANTYQWDFGDGNRSSENNPSHIYSSPGTYTVTVLATNGVCSDIAYGLVVVDDHSNAEIPNVFTPNGDQDNDLFYVKATNVSMIEMSIYNRWGKKIHETSGKQAIWDGNEADQKGAPDGTYFYIITITFNNNPKPLQQNGFISLFR
jgi:gliding motility-associated-like protein